MAQDWASVLSAWKIEKYSPLKIVGTGSFGKAVLVRSTEDTELYICKMINMNKLTERDRYNCMKEVQLLGQLHHPCVVQYMESMMFPAHANDRHMHMAIIMEYADGGDLLQAINKRQGVPFSESKILRIILQVGLALQYLHSNKILHRDIKSENVFLCHNGAVKLGDFGLSRVLYNSQDLAHTCCGTPNYFSPELCDRLPYDAKSDIWAYGCVLYELVNLQRLFNGQKMREVIESIRQWNPKRLIIREGYSHSLRFLLTACLSKNPAERPTIDDAIALRLFDSAKIELKRLFTIREESRAQLSPPSKSSRKSSLVPPSSAPMVPTSKPVQKTSTAPPLTMSTGEESPTGKDQRHGGSRLWIPILGAEVYHTLTANGSKAIEVLSVTPGSVAATSDIRVKDRFVSWDGLSVKDTRFLASLVLQTVTNQHHRAWVEVLRSDPPSSPLILKYMVVSIPSATEEDIKQLGACARGETDPDPVEGLDFRKVENGDDQGEEAAVVGSIPRWVEEEDRNSPTKEAAQRPSVLVNEKDFRKLCQQLEALQM